MEMQQDKIRRGNIQKEMLRLRNARKRLNQEEHVLEILKRRKVYAEKRASETPEQHAERKQRWQRSRSQATLKKNISLEKNVDTFEKDINMYAVHTCEICAKQCYPKQISLCRITETSLQYLPEELAVKSQLQLCGRCKTHISSKKTMPPSKAYWNSLDPGVVPNEIGILTQVERRLISRIIPFLKVMKFAGIFGQYGFHGQAILFAQDICKVSENLPSMLPRSSSDISIVIIAEQPDHVNILKEFRISRERVNNALQWLITNNPLYKDVKIDTNVRLDEADIIQREAPLQYECPQETICHYIPINEVARIVRASWHQGDNEIFTSGYAECNA